jgi:hypothetical protein
MKGMPARNQTVNEAGTQGLYSKQLIPRRLYSNGLYAAPKELGLKKTSNTAEPFTDPGYAYVGFGTVTQGEYSPSKGLWKTFGSVGQGLILQGVKGLAQGDCENRNVFVTLYALEDFSKDDEVHLEFASW